jgi:hypothetical protein
MQDTKKTAIIAHGNTSLAALAAEYDDTAIRIVADDFKEPELDPVLRETTRKERRAWDARSRPRKKKL